MSSTARVTRLRLLLACLSFATVLASQTATAQAVLLSLTNSLWRYEQDRNMDGTGWEYPGFVDDTWPVGRALLGFEDNPQIQPLIQTTLVPPDQPAPDLSAPRTYYFRAQFLYQHADFTTPVLIFSNRLDDGAVFYLNGEEIKRIRMPDGPVTYSTQATSLPPSGDATGWDVFELENPRLNWAPQPNILAVEVHQRGLSADIVFGCHLFLEYVPILWPIPMVQVATQCQAATISVEWLAGGLPATFQWFHNGIAIDSALNATATNATLILSDMQEQDAGSYHVKMTYRQREVTSSPAFVSVAAFPEGGQGTVRMTRSPAGLQVSWDGCGTLEYSTDLVSWNDVPADPLSPYHVPQTPDRSLFYRIRRNGAAR